MQPNAKAAKPRGGRTATGNSQAAPPAELVAAVGPNLARVAVALKPPHENSDAGEQRPLMTRLEVANAFAVSVSSIDRWEKSGWLPSPIKVGCTKRWVKAEVEAVIERLKKSRPRSATA